jgi:hypothetical protein
MSIIWNVPPLSHLLSYVRAAMLKLARNDKSHLTFLAEIALGEEIFD